MVAETYGGPERRHHSRIRRSFLAKCRFRDKTHSRILATVPAWAYDLSPRGMRLYTLEALPFALSKLRRESIPVECCLSLDDDVDTWFSGRTAWVDTHESDRSDDLTRSFFLGVSFDVDQQTGAQIERFLNLHPVPSHPTLEHLASLLEVSHLLTAAISLDHLLELILVTVNRLMNTKASSLLLVDPLTRELYFKVPLGPASRRLKEIRLKPGQGIAGWVAQTGKPILINDVRQDSRFDPKVDALTGFKTQSILAVPLQDRNRILGVVEVLNTAKEKQFDQEDLELLSAFAAHAAVALRNAQLVSSIQEEKRHLQDELEERFRTPISKSASMQRVMQTAQRAAGTHATVLLLGESGVGKEILARSIHAWSPRAAKPFMAINCAAISDYLLESELFGHEKGAFTGAIQRKNGLFELAHGGTLFLDEIGDMKPELQAKLLRVLQEHEFERVGGTQPIRVDIRVIAATNKDLPAAVETGRFRQDLFYRLNVVTIEVPPLRARKEDIVSLTKFFLQRYCHDLKRPMMEISAEAKDVLQRYDWPGNVRELQNVVERAVVLASGETIEAKDLMLGSSPSEAGSALSLLDLPFHDSVEEHKRSLIQHALAKVGGTKSKAAALLKLQPTYLSRLCKLLKIT
jgi:Nif-specific regulatory protein